MQRNMKRIIDRIAVRLFRLPVGDYLRSEAFARFTREQQVDGIWKMALDRMRDRPYLYSDVMIKNVFVEFLLHTFQLRQADFPVIFTGFLAGLVQAGTKPLPIIPLHKDLLDLGFPAVDLEE